MCYRKVYLLQLESGKSPFESWYKRLKDLVARRRILVAITRLSDSDYANYKAVGEEINELRIFYGPGFRVYFAFEKTNQVVLITGGNKNTQSKDIYEAQKIWKKYKNETIKSRREFYN